MFRSLEGTLHERLEGIQEMLLGGSNRQEPFPAGGYLPGNGINRTYVPHPDTAPLLQVIHSQADALTALTRRVEALETKQKTENDLLPLRPMEGIEVIPKKEVVVPEVEPFSYADRLLLNTKARKALEAEEMGETRSDSYPLNCEGVSDKADAEEEVEVDVEEEEAEEEVEVAEEEAEEEVEEEVEVAEEEVEEEAEEEAEVQLEEFEYKGSTYYRDGDNNVYMADEDGELVDEPIGVWNEAKQRITVTKK
jgi:hypothetical protein